MSTGPGRPTDPTAGHGTVVVGVDDGLLRMPVLDRAAAEAHRRNRVLRVVHVHGPAGPSAPWYDDAGERAERYLRRTAPALEVRRSCSGGDVAAALAGAGGSAALLVVGDRHRRLGTGAGRTTTDLIMLASCPVLVVGEERPVPAGSAAHPPVVVAGVDGGRGAAIVLDRALRAARALDGAVEAVQVTGDVGADADLTATVAAARRRVPDVPVDPVLVEGRPGRVLREQARDAALLVVGHRGRCAAGLAGIGSTAGSLLVAPPCPVLVLGPHAVPLAVRQADRAPAAAPS